MANILANVDVSDLLIVNVYKGTPSPGDPNPFIVTVDPIDNTKKVEFDTSALEVLNKNLTEKIKGAKGTDPKTVEYIKEFVTKMVSGLHRSGLVQIVDIPEADDDPYLQAKKAIKRK